MAVAATCKLIFVQPIVVVIVAISILIASVARGMIPSKVKESCNKSLLHICKAEIISDIRNGAAKFFGELDRRLVLQLFPPVFGIQRSLFLIQIRKGQTWFERRCLPCSAEGINTSGQNG